jgi:hypothetical protein
LTGASGIVPNYDYSADLNPRKALIFRITHRDNVPWILQHGLVCASGQPQDPNFVSIGNPDLIAKRPHRPVPIPPGGTLADYVPFYFTPFSPMLYNIHTGHNVRYRPNEEIVILVSSLRRVARLDLDYVFTDRHAYLKAAKYDIDLDNLGQLDWNRLQERQFGRDPEHPDWFDRYQAEALVHRHVPPEALLGIVGYSKAVVESIKAGCESQGLDLKVIRKTGWYF